MFRVLFVEDETTSVEPVILHLNRGTLQYDCRVSDFGAARNEVLSFQPDIVVVDILDGGGSGDPQPEGNKTLDFIWNSRFCPIIIYSAHLDRLEEGAWSTNPFVKQVQKGSGSAQKIEEAFRGFGPHIASLREAEEFIHNVLTKSMRDVAPYAFAELRDEPKQKDTILRCGRRRLAAYMDDTETTDKLASWEIYIHPPVSRHLKLGDILKKKDSPSDDAASFRIVLSPSCDLVTGRSSRTDNVLVARCCNNDFVLDVLSIGLKPNKIKDHLLTVGHRDGFLPIPPLKGRIPSMVADMKKLELLALSDIGDDTKNYLRIASIDSPFRELVAWAYSNTACRPGLPDRDLDSWAAEIIPPKISDERSGN